MREASNKIYYISLELHFLADVCLFFLPVCPYVPTWLRVMNAHVLTEEVVFLILPSVAVLLSM